MWGIDIEGIGKYGKMEGRLEKRMGRSKCCWKMGWRCENRWDVERWMGFWKTYGKVHCAAVLSVSKANGKVY